MASLQVLRLPPTVQTYEGSPSGLLLGGYQMLWMLHSSEILEVPV